MCGVRINRHVACLSIAVLADIAFSPSASRIMGVSESRVTELTSSVKSSEVPSPGPIRQTSLFSALLRISLAALAVKRPFVSDGRGNGISSVSLLAWIWYIGSGTPSDTKPAPILLVALAASVGAPV